MTHALAEALAHINDPEKIAHLLSETGTGQPKAENSVEQILLSDQYERYLLRRRNRSPATIAQYKRTIPAFIDFANENSVTSTHNLTTHIIDAYVDELLQEYDTDATVLTYTKNLRAWLDWLSNRGYCDSALAQILNRDDLGLSPAARDEALPHQQAAHIINSHRKQRFGTAQHALLELLDNTGPRLGGIHSLDVGDIYFEERDAAFHHRPGQGTRLKNGDKTDDIPGNSERVVRVKQEAIDAIEHYVKTERPDVTDEYGRNPLFATSYGRANKSTLRRWVYEATSCRWANTELSDASCDGNCDPDSNVCPHSYYPHAVRRGSIVSHIVGDLSHSKASERFDVSIPVIKRHYDPRVEQARKEDRAEAVQNSWSSY